jgi:hypothetical protein
MGEWEMRTLACTSGSEGSVSTVRVTTSVDMHLGREAESDSQQQYATGC